MTILLLRQVVFCLIGDFVEFVVSQCNIRRASRKRQTDVAPFFLVSQGQKINEITHASIVGIFSEQDYISNGENDMTCLSKMKHCTWQCANFDGIVKVSQNFTKARKVCTSRT